MAPLLPAWSASLLLGLAFAAPCVPSAFAPAQEAARQSGATSRDSEEDQEYEPGERVFAEPRCEHYAQFDAGGELLALERRVWRELHEGEQLELELRFAEQDVLYQHIERLRADSSELIWRESGRGVGRCVLAKWSAGAPQVDLVDTCGQEAVRRSIDARSGALLPLYALQLARTGDAPSGAWPILDPSSAVIEFWTARELRLPGAWPLRYFAWERADGSLAGWYVFAGESLLASARQRGEPFALRISATRYDELLGAFAQRRAQQAADAAALAASRRAARTAQIGRAIRIVEGQ
jgi:hypothetical protein